MMQWTIPAVLLAGFLIIFLHQVESCNEAVCGSVVSKCLLTQSCKCDLQNCTCCKECFSCLSYLYSECCSCVAMCPKPNDTDTGNALSKKSHVEDFQENISGLFHALTDYPDPLNRWNSTTYPVDYNFSHIAISKEAKLQLQSVEQEVVPIKPNSLTLNCTVAFMSQCMSWTKCRSSCQSMGASSFRWFHDGCCECIGEYCINYGINESRCRECPLKEELPMDIYDKIDDDDIDYGEEDENEDFNASQ